MIRRHVLMVLLLSVMVCGASRVMGQGESQKPAPVKPALPKAWVDTLQWRSIGPANMSGRITAFAVSAKDSNTWWAASASGGLLKTTNNGITFEHQFDHEATVSIGDVQVAASDPNIVWVGTGEANPRNSVSWGDGVYKSADGGKTWKNMGLKKSFQIGRIAIHPKNPDIVYVGALGRLWGPNEERGLYKTTDGGKTWKRVLFVDNKTGVVDVQMNPKNPDDLLVAAYERQRDGFDSNDPAKKFGPGSGLYRTTDGGKTFHKITKGLPSGKLGRIGISRFGKNPKQVFLVLESEKIGQWPENAAYAGLQAQDADVGARITQVVAKGPAEKAGLKKDDIVIAVDGKTVHSYRELTGEIHKRRAGDKAKVEVSRDRKGVELEIVFAKRPEPKQGRSRTPLTEADKKRANSPFAASLGGQRENVHEEQGEDGHEYGGVYRSTDGGESWKRMNSVNPRPMYYSQIRVDPSDSKYIWVLGTRLYLSKDGGATFSADGTANGVHPDNHAMWIDPHDGRHVILGNDGGIYVTYDRGKNWDHHNHVAIGQFYHVAVGPRRNYRVYGGLQDNGSWGGPNRSLDGRGPINTDWIRIGGGDGFVCRVDPNDPDLIYSESQGGATGRVNLKTGERGSMRPRPVRGTRYRFNWKTPFILSPHNPTIYYSAGNYVFRSPYKGNQLAPISPDITLTDKGSASALAESPMEEGVLYAGTTDGALWVTRNGGHDWTNIFGKPKKEGKEPEDDKPAEGKEPGSAPAAAGPQTRGGFRGGPGAGPFGPGRGGPGAMIEMLKQRDANGDGKLQKEELPERMSRMLERLDANQDGAIDQDELKSLAERFGRGRMARPGQPPQGQPAGEASDKPAQEAKAGQKAAKAKDKPAQPAKKKEEAKGEKKQEPKQQQKKKEEKPAPKSKAKPAAGETKGPTAEGKKTEQKPVVIKEDIVSGTWEGHFQREGLPPDRSQITVVLRMDPQGKVTGSFKSRMSEGTGEGKFDPETKEVTLDVETERSTIQITGTISGTSMTGEVAVNNGMFTLPFEAKRTGDAPAAAKTTAPKTKPGKPLETLIPGPRWVSSIETSRFKKERVYITLDGHRSDDDKPYVLVSEDYGTTWRSLVSNLPAQAGSARVIREDLYNRNMLFLGTEFAIWVSIDRGESWTKLNSNLPTVAVHEVAIHPTAGEIVAGTHGRSLWILDVAALRQMSAETIAADAYLYKPQSAVKWRSRPSRGSSGTRKFVGQNPPFGATIYYSLGKNAQQVSLKITDVEGKTVRQFEGETKAGLHKVSWDLRRVAPQSRGPGRGGPGRGGPGRFRGGRSVQSGKYLVTLTVDDKELKQVISVEDDPDQ